MTQLNTSPWPTTGTSPVNTAANAGSTSSNGGGGSSTMVSTMSAASSGGPSVAPAANQFGTASFPDWPSQQQQQPPVNPDPFATSNLQSGKLGGFVMGFDCLKKLSLSLMAVLYELKGKQIT